MSLAVFLHTICIAWHLHNSDDFNSGADSPLLLLDFMSSHVLFVISFFSFLFFFFLEELKFEHRTLMLMKQVVRMTQMFKFFNNNCRLWLTFDAHSQVCQVHSVIIKKIRANESDLQSNKMLNWFLTYKTFLNRPTNLLYIQVICQTDLQTRSICTILYSRSPPKNKPTYKCTYIFLDLHAQWQIVNGLFDELIVFVNESAERVRTCKYNGWKRWVNTF